MLDRAAAEAAFRGPTISSDGRLYDFVTVLALTPVHQALAAAGLSATPQGWWDQMKGSHPELARSILQRAAH